MQLEDPEPSSLRKKKEPAAGHTTREHFIDPRVDPQRSGSFAPSGMGPPNQLRASAGRPPLVCPGWQRVAPGGMAEGSLAARCLNVFCVLQVLPDAAGEERARAVRAVAEQRAALRHPSNVVIRVEAIGSGGARLHARRGLGGTRLVLAERAVGDLAGGARPAEMDKEGGGNSRGGVNPSTRSRRGPRSWTAARQHHLQGYQGAMAYKVGTAMTIAGARRCGSRGPRPTLSKFGEPPRYTVAAPRKRARRPSPGPASAATGLPPDRRARAHHRRRGEAPRPARCELRRRQGKEPPAPAKA